MSRRRPASGATISLFPFLAVLLCTMGALLVLLVIFSRRARESEVAAAQAAEQAQAEEIALARDELRWRIEQLEGVRARTAEDLARERMRLAGIEEDARRLSDELAALEETAEALGREDSGDAAAAATAEAEGRLAQARAALDEARAAGSTRPPAYAVVPYEGANGTHRRPLYVECCIDGVFLQPEGIRLGPGDFEGPPGPGNPLASGLRAAREHVAGKAAAGDPATQPYPLLLVRPSGVMAYYAAREALTSWGSEFGYQFVDEDWQLQYPPADPALAAVEQRAIDESRQRMEWLAQVRPTRPARPTQQYRASTTRGGVVAEGGPTVLGDRSRFDWTEEQAGSAGRLDAGGAGGADGSGDARQSTAAGGTGGDVVLGGGRGGSGGGGDGVGDRYAGPSRFYAAQPPTGDGAGGGGDGPGPGGPHSHGTRGEPGAGGADARGLAGMMGSGPGDDSAVTGGGSGASSGGSTSTAGAAGAAGSSGAGGGSGSTAAAGSGSGMAGATAGGATGGGGGMTGGPALPGMRQGSGGSSAASGSASASLAGSRGSNWASLATAERPIPLTRPIRVECAATEFRIYDDGGHRIETRIPIGTRTSDSVDPLVQAVHARVGRWGLAGDRMYWRPELVLSATADGGPRREDLERLLADSGLDTRRVDPDSRVLPLPPVSRTTAVTGRR